MRAYNKGTYKVTRKCCTSGRCFYCKGSPKRITHTDHVSKSYAEEVAGNWTRAGYDAKVEKMEGVANA